MRYLLILFVLALFMAGCNSPSEPQQGDYILGSPLLEIRNDDFNYPHLWLIVESSQQAHARVRKNRNGELDSSWDVIVPCERDIMSATNPPGDEWYVEVTTDGTTWHQSNEVTF
jgi:hypothetical protein